MSPTGMVQNLGWCIGFQDQNSLAWQLLINELKAHGSRITGKEFALLLPGTKEFGSGSRGVHFARGVYSLCSREIWNWKEYLD